MSPRNKEIVRRDEMTSVSGRSIDLKNPSPSSIHIIDIAHGLANEQRFAGQNPFDLNVARHSINVMLKVREWGGSPAHQLYALLHDSAEAYLGDCPSPVKTAGFRKVEDRLLNVILEKYLGVKGLAKLPAWLKAADDDVLRIEKRMRSGLTFLCFKRRDGEKSDFLNHFRNLYQQVMEGPQIEKDQLANLK